MIYVLSGGVDSVAVTVIQAFTSLEKAQAYCSRLTDPWKEHHANGSIYWTAAQRDALEHVGGGYLYWQIDLVDLD